MITNINFDNIESCIQDILNINVVDLTNLNWIEPVGIAAISIAKTLNDVEIIFPENRNVSKYLEVMRLNQNTANYCEGNTYVPLIDLGRGNSDRIARDIVKKVIQNASLSSDADLQHDLTQYLTYMIVEILNNVIDHSISNVTPVATAQYYPALHKCQIAIVDNGIGFLKSLQHNYPGLVKSSDALLKAIGREVTGARPILYGGTTRNIGYGLYFISEIIKFTGGSLKIISNDGMLKISSDGFTISNDITCAWQGSIVTFNLYTNKLNHDFQELLNIIMVPPGNDEIEDFF